MARDRQDEAEGSRDWVSILQTHWSRCCLVAGGQEEAIGEAWALAHLPVTRGSTLDDTLTLNSVLISLGRLQKDKALTLCSSKFTLQLKDRQPRPDTPLHPES